VELARPQRLLADALPTAAAAAMLALSVAWVVGGGVLLLQAHAWVHASRGGASGPWAVLASLGVCFVLPAIVGVDCAARLRRRERRGWAIAMMLPVGAALLLSLELPWFVVAAALLPALLVVSPAVRWRMGIGPSSVIAEIEARKRVSLTKLAERHGVDRSALHHLLAWQVRVGRFHGALDVAGDEAISADTAANDAERQRCPGCGSAVRARGAVLRCGFCGTALVGSRRIEPPLPLPLSLELIAAALGLLALLAVGVGVVSTTILLEAGASGGALVAGVIVCAVLPVLWSLALRRAARGLVDGDNRARVLAGVVVPPVWLYLRQPLLRCLFGVGHQALEEQLARKGGCSLDDAARILGLRGGDVDTVVPFLVGRRWIAGVVDWHERRIVAAHFLAVDGRRRCNGCGSPLRVGGQCAWCGLVEEPRAPPAPPTPPSGSASVSAPTAS
jgi:hypothetical protein